MSRGVRQALLVNTITRWGYYTVSDVTLKYLILWLRLILANALGGYRDCYICRVSFHLITPKEICLIRGDFNTQITIFRDEIYPVPHTSPHSTPSADLPLIPLTPPTSAYLSPLYNAYISFHTLRHMNTSRNGIRPELVREWRELISNRLDQYSI